MNIGQELEKLAQLQSRGALSQEEFVRAKALVLSGQAIGIRSVRRQSRRFMLGLPLWAIAVGPNPEKGELRGHAKAIFAVGDIATGFVAIGGFARGIIALGGGAIGLLAIGGGALGAIALGGGAIGGIAIGGGALGVIAIGGGAAGYYALGSGAAGTHIISVAQQDPVAVNFFCKCLPFLKGIFRAR